MNEDAINEIFVVQNVVIYALFGGKFSNSWNCAGEKFTNMMSGGPQVVPKPFKLMLKSYTFDWMIDEQRMFSLLCAELIITALLCFTQRVKYTHLKNRGAFKNRHFLRDCRVTGWRDHPGKRCEWVNTRLCGLPPGALMPEVDHLPWPLKLPDKWPKIVFR